MINCWLHVLALLPLPHKTLSVTLVMQNGTGKYKMETSIQGELLHVYDFIILSEEILLIYSFHFWIYGDALTVLVWKYCQAVPWQPLKLLKCEVIRSSYGQFLPYFHVGPWGGNCLHAFRQGRETWLLLVTNAYSLILEEIISC